MKTLNERLAWLAGILDGEGYVSATINSSNREQLRTRVGRGRSKKGTPAERVWIRERSLRFQVRVAATDAAMIDEVASIYDTIGVEYFTFEWQPNKPQHKKEYGVHVNGGERVRRLLEAVRYWLVTKRPQAELLLRMISRRKNLPYRARGFDDPVLVEMLSGIRKLNQRGVKVSGQVPANGLDRDHSRIDVVGAQQGAEHPHLTETGLRTEPSAGMGESPRR